MKITDFRQARDVLAQYALGNPGEAYTLDRMRRLMDFLGNPQDAVKVIHVAGTSGKTSTAYYLTALLRAAGQKVGLTISPHIDEVNERVQINLVPLSQKEFCRELGAFLEHVDPDHRHLTYFEILVAFAYTQFAKHQVDYAVVEVGLGGRLDGTNVVSRADKVCVITDIGLDHTDRLGHTLGAIARQKAGIILPHNQVFTFHQNDQIMTAIKEIAQTKQAELHVVPPLPPAGSADQAALPMFQQHNYELAKSVYDFVSTRDQLPSLSSAQLESVAQTYIPARMEIVELGDKIIVLDGAHNAQKMRALATSMKARFPDHSIATLIAVVESADFSLRTDLQPILNLSHRLYVTGFASQQDYPKVSVDPQKVADHCVTLGYHEVTVMPDPAGAFEALLKTPEPVLLVTGSFYLMNHVRPLIHRKEQT